MAETQVMSLEVSSDECVDVLRSSVTAVFSMFCGEEPSFLGLGNDGASGSVIGIIAMVGDVSWSLAVGFSNNTAEAMARQFAGMDIPFDSPDMSDVVGELANVLAGDVVARLDERGVKVGMSIPTVALGKDMNLAQPGAVSSLQIRFGSPQGEFVVGLTVGRSSD